MNLTTNNLNLNNCTPAQIVAIAKEVVAADERRAKRVVR